MDIKHLTPPTKKIDVILDTDTYNEIDDQFAVTYLLKNEERLNCIGLTAAPFLNDRSICAKDGMEKSYNEILKLLELIGKDVPVYKGSENFLSDEVTPVDSPAARAIVKEAEKYTSENPLYVVAIGAITNVASALLINPEIADNIVIVWLGGVARQFDTTAEFNMRQDICAARVCLSSNASFVQLPCKGVVSAFYTNEYELREWLIGKTPVSTYLAENTIGYCDGEKRLWSKIIWDVTAVAWLLNDGNNFLEYETVDTVLPGFDGHFEKTPINKKMGYVNFINRDALMSDLFEKITK